MKRYWSMHLLLEIRGKAAPPTYACISLVELFYDHSMESCQNMLKMFRGYQLGINILKEKGIVSASKCGGCGLLLMGVVS